MSQSSYLQYTQVPSGGRPANASYSSLAQAISTISSTASNAFASSSTSRTQGVNQSGVQPSFQAPAHKHAHHLHSIPPREKSTRTLIIDHMLWVHGTSNIRWVKLCIHSLLLGRTRFAQARAELGMTDPTGGPNSSNYTHRHRPENYEEEDEAVSEGEEVVTLKARAGDPGRPHNDDEDEKLRTQDLILARSLRLRAEGLEKVVTSMLDQPPPVHPNYDDDFPSPPTSPNIPPTNQRKSSSSHQHTLPNGVRLRLALGTMINDLFARQSPIPRFREQQQQQTPKSPELHSTPTQSTSSSDTSSGTIPSSSSLPLALTSLSSVSAYSTATHIPYAAQTVSVSSA